jgi:eukaryotic-like serine/threonine-protein kinase
MTSNNGHSRRDEQSRDEWLSTLLLARHKQVVEAARNSDADRAETNANLATGNAPLAAELAELADLESCLRELEETRRETIARQGESTPRRGQTTADEFQSPPIDGEEILANDGRGTAQRIGRFAIERELGRGGFGIVLAAYDPLLKRHVAIKIPRPEALLLPRLRERLAREVHAAARLTHPNIVPIHEVGEVGPIVFIVASLVDGESLAAWTKSHAELINPRWAAATVAELASAMHYAHSQGVLHRDLKPSNVLIERRSRATDASAANAPDWLPKITDFGLAKVNDLGGSDTRTGAILGTPEYMSPEQARGDLAQIGVGTDIYALGAILYELLTGRPPFRGRSETETLARLCGDEPPPPRRLNPTIPRDIEAIALKCLEKRPQDRYPSAAALSDDLARFLSGESTYARPLSSAGRVVRWSRRRPLPAALLAAVGVLVASVAIVASVAAFRINLARQDAERSALLADRRASEELAARKDAERTRDELQNTLSKLARSESEINEHVYPEQFGLALKAYHADDTFNAKRHLQQIRDARLGPPTFEWRWLWDRVGGNVRGLDPKGGHIYVVNFTPDGKHIVAGDEAGLLAVWDANSHALRHRIQAHGSCINRISYSPTESLAATASCDKTVKLWDSNTWQVVGELPAHHAAVYPCVFSPDGRWLATGTHRQLADAEAPAEFALWDVASRSRLAEWRAEPSQCMSLDFLEGGKSLVAGFRNGAVKQWDISDLPPVSTQVRFPLDPPPFDIGAPNPIYFGNSLRSSPDGRYLFYTAGSTAPDKIILVDLLKMSSFKFADGYFPHGGLQVSPDGSLAILSQVNLPLQLRTVPQGDVLATLGCPNSFAIGAALSPDNRALVTTSKGGSVLYYDLSMAYGTHFQCDSPDDRIGFDAETQRLYYCSKANRIEFRHVLTGQVETREVPAPGTPQIAIVSPDGRWACVRQFRDDSQSLTLLDLSGQQPTRQLGQGRVCPAFSSDSQMLALASATGGVCLVELPSLQIRWDVPMPPEVQSSTSGLELTFSPDGHWLTLTGTGIVQGTIFNVRDGFHGWFDPQAMRSSPDSQSAVRFRSGHNIRVVEMLSGFLIREMSGHTDIVHDVDFSPDGRTLASASHDGTLRLWHAATGQEICRLLNVGYKLKHCRFSSDGRTLVCWSEQLPEGHVNVHVFHAPQTTYD